MREFLSSSKFRYIFLKEIGLSDCEVTNAFHSKVTKDGESDIVFHIDTGKTKLALFIEDKVNAIAMPNQAGRYIKRAKDELEISSGSLSSYEIFICAPQSYLETNAEAKKYHHQVSYESLLQYFVESNDFFSQAIINFALDKKKMGYVVDEDTQKTIFWSMFYDYREREFPELYIRRTEGPRGHSSVWPTFTKLPSSYCQIVYKSDRGCVDLEIKGLGSHIAEVSKAVSHLLPKRAVIAKAGKSVAIRIKTPAIAFADFDNEMHLVRNGLLTVRKLYNLSYEPIIISLHDEILKKFD
jgi:hypothetical protein